MNESPIDPSDEEPAEFQLPQLDPIAFDDPEDERERYDEQILAGLVSP